jgi:hypothetical protein
MRSVQDAYLNPGRPFKKALEQVIDGLNSNKYDESQYDFEDVSLLISKNYSFHYFRSRIVNRHAVDICLWYESDFKMCNAGFLRCSK